MEPIGAAIPAAAGVILLDTNALIWIEQSHPRARLLLARRHRLYLSPATLLEVQFLHETGRIRMRSGTIRALVDDERWMLDDPPAASWFLQAVDQSWTRDPFDRLIVAHAQLRRWRLATSDGHLARRLGPDACIEL